jgi:type II secretory pathway component PulC
MKENISPEERLLRLIKGQKKEAVASSVEKKPAIVTEGLKPSIKRSISPLSQKYFSILYIRRIIWAAFILSNIYLVISLVYPWFGLTKIYLPKVKEERIIEPIAEPKQDKKPFEFYSEGIRNRRIFVSESAPVEEKTVSVADADLIKDLNLLGIVSGENPQAVIEDKKTKKTYYVNKGQFINELMIEDIQEGKVILNYKGQRFELYL